MTDEELLELIAKGDPAACRMLVDRHLPGLVRFAVRMLRDPAEGEDVAQETFVRLWQNVEGFEGRSQVRTFLFRIAHNLAIDRIRKRKKTTSEFDELADRQPLAFQRMESREQQEAVQRAIARLPERQQAALSMVHFEGLAQADVAEIMGISVDALESLLARARRTLRKEFVQAASKTPPQEAEHA